MAKLAPLHCSSHPHTPRTAGTQVLHTGTHAAPSNVLLHAQGYQGRCSAKLAERQTKCKNHLRVTNVPNLILLLVKPGPGVWIFRTKHSPPCYNTWERQMRRAHWHGGSTVSTATILVSLHFVSVPRSQDSLVTAGGGPDLTWMKHKELHSPFTQNPYHTQHLLKDTRTCIPSKAAERLHYAAHTLYVK